MKNKKGFISTTVVYTFFFVFLMMLLFIIVKYSDNRNLLKVLKEDVKTSLQDSVLLGDICNNQILSRCFSKYYSHDSNIIFHNNTGAKDESYRYSGANNVVNNYICFGSEEATCPSENLYRIIGLFKNSSGDYQAKIIKSSIATTDVLNTDNTCASNLCYWNTSDINNWESSTLNIVNLNINYANYINNISDKWFSKLALSEWVVGGVSQAGVTDNATDSVYISEIKTPATNAKSQASIGLMYVSDYMYAASNTYWTTKASSYEGARSSNWMYLSQDEWTITRSTSGNNAFYITSSGNVSNGSVRTYKAVRPVFYLSVTAKVIGGHGTTTDPYRIEV